MSDAYTSKILFISSDSPIKIYEPFPLKTCAVVSKFSIFPFIYAFTGVLFCEFFIKAIISSAVFKFVIFPP